MITDLYVTEGVIEMGVDEIRAFAFDTTPWCITPVAGTTKVVEANGGAWVDRTATLSTGSASALGNIVSTPKFGGGTEGHTYLAIVLFSAGGNTWAAHIPLRFWK